MKAVAVVLSLLTPVLGMPTLASSQTFGAQSMYAAQTAQRLAPALATVLAGEGDKVVRDGTGIVIGNNGVVVTSYSLIENARSLQVRIGDKLYDRVVLLAFDQDRDLAALRIAATNLSLPNIRTAAGLPGEQVFVLWTRGQREPNVALATLNRVDFFTRRDGKHQYSMLQFDAPLVSPVPGGALVDGNGRILGMVTAGRGENAPHMAVPMTALLQFSEFSGRVFDSGSELRLDGDPLP
ncbi:MAG: serine protease, partial [Acidobacteriales bacterium]|nr:serine protease [Terriglobales bacterium]